MKQNPKPCYLLEPFLMGFQAMQSVRVKVKK